MKVFAFFVNNIYILHVDQVYNHQITVVACSITGCVSGGCRLLHMYRSIDSQWITLLLHIKQNYWIHPCCTVRFYHSDNGPLLVCCHTL